MLGADFVVGVDMDDDAISQAVQNAEDIGVDDVMEFVRADVTTFDKVLRFSSSAASAADAPASAADTASADASCAAGGAGEGEPRAAAATPAVPLRLFDTVVMNPPFGTRKAGVDMDFLAAALAACHPSRGVVYSMHKSSTRAHIARTATEAWGCAFEVVAELRFDIPATYAFHREAVVDVAVDLIRISRRGSDAAVPRSVAAARSYVAIEEGDGDAADKDHFAPAGGRRVAGGSSGGGASSGRGRGRGGSSRGGASRGGRGSKR